MKPTLKPMRHQLVSLKHDEKNPIVYDTSEPGTGKTAVRIWGFAKRHKKDGKRALVLAPRSLLKAVWAADFRKFAPHIKTSVAFAENRETAFNAKADVYITNHDASKWLARKTPAWFKRMDFNELIVDEITAYKHHTSQRGKAAKKIAQHFKQRKGLTGTPNTVTILDVWHQVNILDDGKRLGNSFYAMRGACCTPTERVINTMAVPALPDWIADRVGQSGAQRTSRSVVEWTDKEGIEEVIFGQLADISVRHMLDDCADIPKNHHYPMEFTLPTKQRLVYDDLEKAQILHFSGRKLTAVNASALATKLLQTASGAVYTSTDDYTVIDSARYDFVLDLVEARRHPLVFFLWKHQRDMLVKGAETRGMRYEVIDGDSNDDHRAETEKRYQNGLLDVLFAHPKTVAHGFTLTRGTSTIWSSPTQNLEWYDQGSRRQRRIGQTHKTETITVLADTPVEAAVYEDLQRKDKNMSHFLRLIHAMTQEHT